MQPNYYLLRDNLESGPYTIDELLLQGLKPSDLVWVEGRNSAWCHPSELEELTVSFSVNKEKLKSVSKPPPPERIQKRSRRHSDDEIETRAEEIRRNILAHKVQTPRLEIKEEATTSHFRLPEERIDLVVHRKKITLPGAHATAAGIMLLFIAGAWYGRDLWVNNSRFLDAVAKPFESKAVVTIPEKKETPLQNSFSLAGLPVVQDSSIGQLVTLDSSAAKSDIQTGEVVLSKPVSSYREESSDTPSLSSREIQPVAQVIKKEDTARIEKKITEEKKEPARKEIAENQEKKNSVDQQSEVKKPLEVKKESDTVKTEAVKEEAPKKKKGFLGGLFKKKKKNEEE